MCVHVVCIKNKRRILTYEIIDMLEREGGEGDRGEREREKERGMCVVRCGLKQRVAIKREKRCDFVNQQMKTDLCFVRQYITQIK